MFKSYMGERGAHIIEFALVALIFFMAFFGVVELGLLSFSQASVRSAALQAITEAQQDNVPVDAARMNLWLKNNYPLPFNMPVVEDGDPDGVGKGKDINLLTRRTSDGAPTAYQVRFKHRFILPFFGLFLSSGGSPAFLPVKVTVSYYGRTTPLPPPPTTTTTTVATTTTTTSGGGTTTTTTSTTTTTLSPFCEAIGMCPDGFTMNYGCRDSSGAGRPGECFGDPHENPSSPGTCTHCPGATTTTTTSTTTSTTTTTLPPFCLAIGMCPDGFTMNYGCRDSSGAGRPGECFGDPHEDPFSPGACTHCPGTTTTSTTTSSSTTSSSTSTTTSSSTTSSTTTSSTTSTTTSSTTSSTSTTTTSTTTTTKPPCSCVTAQVPQCGENCVCVGNCADFWGPCWCDWDCLRTQCGDSGCFHPDSGVLLSDGSIKAAQDVTHGDKVVNPINGETLTVSVIIAGPEVDPLVKITLVTGESIRVSKTHPFIVDGTLTMAKDVKEGNSILRANNTYGEVRVVELEKLSEDEKVFNFVFRETGELQMPWFRKIFAVDGFASGEWSLQNELEASAFGR